MGRFNKIYVLAPYKFTTGGAELSHQLVDVLNCNGQEAYIVYATDEQTIANDQSILDEYKMYNIRTTYSIEDCKENILIIPEVFFEFILKYDNIEIGCWWMSVDNRYKGIRFVDWIKYVSGYSIRDYIHVAKLHYIKKEFNLLQNSNDTLIDNEHRITHFYQSIYAQQHILALGCNNLLPLSDYINTAFCSSHLDTKKENIVLYNPKKGYTYTKKIIDALPDIEFVPLQGLTRSGLKGLMQRAKLYIDFGHFPGKDRLPREAVMNNCCIITGKLGASKYFEDVPVLSSYKFDTISSNISVISEKILEVLNNFDICCKDFDLYRKRVILEKKHFIEEVNTFFL